MHPWLRGMEADHMCWNSSSLKGFDVRSYYEALLPCSVQADPWKANWKLKVSLRVVFFFFVREAVMGRILTIDD